MIDYSKSTPVKSCVVGTNADLIAEVSRLYIPDGSVVADVTFGRGVFWKKVDYSNFVLLTSDLKDGVDFQKLPYEDEFLDTLVLDPPYQPYTRSMQGGLSDRYGLNASNLWTMEEVIDLYRGGMWEAMRTLKPEGKLWLKCQDVTYNHRFTCTHCKLILHAKDIGFHLRDMFVLAQTGGQLIKSGWKNQQHARKNHSYLLILQKGKYT